MCAVFIRSVSKHGPRSQLSVQVSRDSDPSGTDGKGRSCGSLVKAQAPARLNMPTALHHFAAVRTQEPDTRVQVLSARQLGYVLHGQPTVIFRVS